MNSNLEGSDPAPFSFKNGNLYCENLEVGSMLKDLAHGTEETKIKGINGNDKEIRIAYDVPSTPVFVYSKLGLQENVKAYESGLVSAGLQGKIGYAIKANPNIPLVSALKASGIEVIITVSGFEVLAAMRAGFSPENIIFNGNGKQRWEVKLAIELGVMMNVDSLFDACQIVEVHREIFSENEVKVLLRMKPVNGTTGDSTILSVHEYVNTAENSKFGFDITELDHILEVLSSNEKITIVGIHCHFGSGISDPKAYEWLGTTMSKIVDELEKRGVSVEILNVGGGIGIDYKGKPPGFMKFEGESPVTDGVPEITEFLKSLALTLPKNKKLILEPGRSLVGKAGILLCKVLGVKPADGCQLLVVDGSMNEVIRPCLYGAHHNIFPISFSQQDEWTSFDVVGPICESADFLGRNVLLPKATQSYNYVAVMDTGAYCSSMASNYNLKPRATEILVDGNNWTCIRKRETFEDIVNKMTVD